MARIGTSGWSYPHWRGVLYEPGVTAGGMLARYAQEFDTVELNGSFYRWPPSARMAQWASAVPAGFTFAVKGPRGLTHGSRLARAEAWVPRIRDALAGLGDHAGPLLLQLPGDLERDDELLDRTLAELAPVGSLAVELRHRSWVSDDVFAVLAAHAAAYCVTSGAGLPCELRVTAPFAYVRLHGPSPDALYAGSYTDQDIRWWADRIREWEAGGTPVFAYFNNDGAGNAVRNARTLHALLADQGTG